MNEFKQEGNETSTQARPLLLLLVLPLSWKAPTRLDVCLCKSSRAQGGSWVANDKLLKKEKIPKLGDDIKTMRKAIFVSLLKQNKRPDVLR